MALSIETYALCKKYCDEHAASLTPEQINQVSQAIINHFNNNPNEIVTNAELENFLNNKLDLMLGDEYTAGNAYNLPYFFETEANANKIVVKAKTVTLDGNKTHNEYTMDVLPATITTAGLMSAADKEKLNNAITDLTNYATINDVNNAIANYNWEEQIESFPEGTESTQALIYNGTEWIKQSGYGYEIAPETNISFNGNINNLTKIETSYFPFYKLSYNGYLPTADDLMGQTVYFKYNGELEVSEWNSDDIQSSPEGTLEIMKDNFSDTMIIIYEDTTFSKYDDKEFTKGIWIAKQDDANYIADIYFGPVIAQIDSKFIPSDDNKASVDAVVNLTEDQTINGEKQFISPIKFESGLSTTSFGQNGVTIGAFAQPTTKYNFTPDGNDYVTDGEVTVASREWVESQGYITNDSGIYTAGDGIEITDDNVINSTATFSVQYISLEGTSGTLTDEELTVLQDNSLNYIYLNGDKYEQAAYAVGKGGIFATYSARPGISNKNIIIAVGAKTWEYSENSIYDNSTIVNSSNKLAVNPNLSISTITTSSAAKFNNNAINIKTLANNKNGIIGSGSLVLNRNTSYNESSIGENSVIVGSGCWATNEASFAAGKGTRAGGSYSFAINEGTNASNVGTFAQGHQTLTVNYYAQALGEYTTAAGRAQTVVGKLNKPDETQSMFIVGTGNSSLKRSGRDTATDLIGLYKFDPEASLVSNRCIEITNENCESIWDDSNITTVYDLKNGLEVDKNGNANILNTITAPKISDGTITRNMSDLLSIKIQQITLADYTALTTKDSNTLYLITNS